ncbi:hypothetical protein K7432_010821 [Basidiobolus ranarum]|uniref:Uncharacterized protein n=1 Tax=Basidiobolus ranarum TaxID=34480 RepID=A0ABR2WN86_9FUNG
MKQFSISALTTITLWILGALAVHGAPAQDPAPASSSSGYQTRNTDNDAATIYCSIFKLNCDTECKSRRGTSGNECNSTGSNNFRIRCACRNGSDATSNAADKTPTRSTNNPGYHTTDLGQNANGDDYCNRQKGHCQDVCRNASPRNWRYESKCNWKRNGNRTTASGLCVCNKCDIAYTAGTTL